MKLIWISVLVLAASLVVYSQQEPASQPTSAPKGDNEKAAKQAIPDDAAVAILAGGCFWCIESPFDKIPGVYDAVSGYTDGEDETPTYKEVSRGTTGHTEAVAVYYDPTKLLYEDLLEVFWRQIDPGDGAGQFADRGSQYRTGIYVMDDTQKKIAEASKKKLEESKRFDEPIVVPILPAKKFYPAEEYHQDYWKKSPRRYKSYHRASGRGPYIKKTWGDDLEVKFRKPAVAGKKFEKPSDDELRKTLTPLQYKVTQQDGTEPPFKNEFWDSKKPGIYVDIVSGEPLFSSTHKYKSGTGWPSFYRPLVTENVTTTTDYKIGYARTEVRSKNADSHLGHVFNDGPAPTGKRYCINSAALRFVPAEDLETEGLGEFRKLFEKK